MYKIGFNLHLLLVGLQVKCPAQVESLSLTSTLRRGCAGRGCAHLALTETLLYILTLTALDKMYRTLKLNVKNFSFSCFSTLIQFV